MNILITGASSGIGRALARYYSNQDVNLFLCGRNSQALNDFKTSCSENKANIYIKVLDVTNKKLAESWVDEIEKSHKIDLVIANAGISAGTSGGLEPDQQIRKIFDVNLYGVLNIINPAVAKMKARKKGQVAIISSLAGFRGLPSSPAYSASKAAVRVYGEGLRGNLSQFGIKVNVVCPGYVETAMTAVNDFYMPFLMKVDKAAEKIANGIKKNKSRITFPFPLYFVVWFLSILPPSITDKLFANLPKKKGMED